MGEERKVPRLVSWVQDHLTHKVVLILIAIAIVNWLLLSFVFLSALESRANVAYAAAISGAGEAALRELWRYTMAALTIFSLCLIVVIALLVYLVGLAPIARLRQTMRRYSETGEKPQRTDRSDEIGRLQNTFADLVDTVERKEQAERRLIASISHDIKTPLTSVLGYSERLRAAELSQEKRRQYLDLIHEKALRLKAVVDEFDDYLDAGLRDAAPMRLMTVEELCRRLRQEFAAELSDAGVAFSLDCDCPDAQFFGSWEQLRRVFGNLIDNSFQHAGVERLRLSCTVTREGDRLVFRFQDNGRGVPPALLEQIFEPLYTSDQGRKVSGLGLSICKSVVKAHGGAIHAENAPGGGLRVVASLPAVAL